MGLYAGIRLDQNPVPQLHKTRLGKWGPVTVNSAAMAKSLQ
jgi:hypothetical protein